MPTILTKKSDTPGSVPATADLTNAAGGAELAVNTADKRLFALNSSSAVVEIGTNPGSLTTADASATVFRSGSATITNLIATTGTVSDLSATVARVGSGTVTTLVSTSATITNLTATSATISNFTFTSATVTRLAATSATISDLSATVGRIGSATITNLTASGGSVTLTTVGATSGSITTLSSSSGTVTNLIATTGTIANLRSTDFSATVSRSASGTITNLIATTASISDLSATVTRSASATLTNLTSTSGTITTLVSTSATLTTIAGTSANITTITENASPVVVQTDIGTDPNEIPLNQYLGTMAFQDATAVTIDQAAIDSLTVSSGSTLNGGVVINELGADADTRIEGDTDANLFFVDASADQVGIGTSSPEAKLDVNGNVHARGASFPAFKFADSSGTAEAEIYYGISANDLNIVSNQSGGTINLQTGGGVKATLDASGNLGVGTTSPGATLELARTSADVGMFITRSSTGAASYRQFIDGDGDIRLNMVSSKNMRFFTADTERARITAAGDLLVGTTSTTADGAAVIGFGGGYIVSDSNDSVANNGTLDITLSGSGGGYQGLLIVANTNVGNAVIRTQSTSSVFGRGTAATITTINSANGPSGGASFTITVPSNGVIRVTNTSGSTTSISIQFIGGNSF